MASYGDVLAVLKDYRNDLEQKVQSDLQDRFNYTAPAFAQTARGGMAAFSTPSTNIHASGAGIRVRNGVAVPDEFVIKVYVFDKSDPGLAAPLNTSFNGVEIDIEALPVQLALHAFPTLSAPANQTRHRPIVAGTSIAPLNEAYVGTLGLFLNRLGPGNEQIYALSNNHVLAKLNRLKIGTQIVQPGAETMPTTHTDVFCTLSDYISLEFPSPAFMTPINFFDAAIAVVGDIDLISKGKILGIQNYTPKILAAVPGMHVIKSGRTTGISRGVVTATQLNGVQVNYGTPSAPLITTFNDTITIIGLDGQPFSAPGDSGAAIIDEASGQPIALLFAGDGHTTTACDIGGICQHFQAFLV